MPYHQGLQRVQGDPGFFSFLGKVGGTILRAAPGPIGTIAKAVGLPTFGGGTRQPTTPPIIPTFTGAKPPTVPTPGVRATPALPGTCPPKKRRRMDPLNMKALRRANRRQKAFLRAVDSTLKGMPTKAGVQRRRRQISSAKK